MSKCQCSRDFREEPFAMLSGKSTYIHTYIHACIDLFEDTSDQDLQRVTVLYVSRNTSTPEAPGNEPHLKEMLLWASEPHRDIQTCCSQISQDLCSQGPLHPPAKAGAQSSANSTVSCNATGHGQRHTTDGNRTAVGFTAVHVASDFTRPPRSRSLRRGLRKSALS